MNVYKIEVIVIDFDELGAEGIKVEMENVRYPNRCISPDVINTKVRDIGVWQDDHPLNKHETRDAEIDRLFGVPDSDDVEQWRLKHAKVVAERDHAYRVVAKLTEKVKELQEVTREGIAPWVAAIAAHNQVIDMLRAQLNEAEAVNLKDASERTCNCGLMRCQKCNGSIL